MGVHFKYVQFTLTVFTYDSEKGTFAGFQVFSFADQNHIYECYFDDI